MMHKMLRFKFILGTTGKFVWFNSAIKPRWCQSKINNLTFNILAYQHGGSQAENLNHENVKKRGNF